MPLRLKNLFVYALLLSTFFFTASCKENSFGSGQGGGTVSKKPRPNPVPPVGSGTTLPEPANCPRTTQAKTITTVVNLSAQNPEISYEISVANCVGSLTDLNGKALRFDIDAMVTPFAESISAVFAPADNSSASVSASLRSDDSEDLFGNKTFGENRYAHWRIDSLNLPQNTTKIVLTIKLARGTQLENRKNPSSRTIPTLLKIGNDVSVATSNITYQ